MYPVFKVTSLYMYTVDCSFVVNIFIFHFSASRSRKSPSRTKQKEADSEEVEEVVPTGFWITTDPDGDRVCTRIDGSRVPVKRALISTASDPATNQAMRTREDHVITVTHPDGTTVVEHADGTRISSFWREVAVTVAGDMSEETGKNKAATYYCAASCQVLYRCF